MVDALGDVPVCLPAPSAAAGAELDLPRLRDPDPERAAAVDAFVDPGLHRNRGRWEDREVSPAMRDLAEDVWQRVQPLAGDAPETPELHASLDEARHEFDAFYAEAEALVHTSLYAARRGAAKPRARKPPPPPPTLRARITRRVPLRYRRRVRRVVRQLGRRR
jgi:hypothetical protein